MEDAVPVTSDELAVAEAHYRQVKQTNPFFKEVSLRNFEKQLPLQWNQAFKYNGNWYIPAAPSVAEDDKPFVLYRFLTFSSGSDTDSWEVCYYILPTSNEYIAENIVKGSYAVQHYYRQAINSIPTSIPYRLAIKKGKSQTDISNNAPVPYNCDVVVIDWYWQTWENGILVSEEYLFSTRELDCEGSSGGGYSTDSTKNPCDSVNKLALNAEFRAKLDSLKLRAEATSNKREVGYYYTNTTANSFDETMSIGETDELSVEMYIPDGNKIDGIVHNHFFAEGRSESIFSMGDMQKLIEVYSKGQMNNPYTFSMTLVTQHGDRYMLKINDLSEFSSWATKYNNQELLKTMMLIYHTVPDKSGENYRAFNELNFLKFLDKSNAGLKFFKANTTNNTWQPFKRSGETVIADPC